MLSRAQRNKIAVSLWTARIIPIVLAGIVAYATYVVIALLSVNYLIKKHHDYGAAVPIITVYCILLLLMAISFFRLFYVTTFDPPYVPLGADALSGKRIRNKSDSRDEEDGIAAGEYDPGSASGEDGNRDDLDSPGLEHFYTKDVFVCRMDGRPNWCHYCSNWKPDRAHHCSSSGRCVLKMDHFCPWVGGPVGENNLKFFIQFTGYTALYCIHILVVMAIYIRQQKTTPGEDVNAQFAAILGIAAFFGFFTGGMVGSSVTMAMANYTQVEQLGMKQRVYTLAVLKPPAEAINLINHYAASNISYPQITYPLEPGSLVIPGQLPGEERRRYSERLAESYPGSSPARMPNLMPVEDQSIQTGSTRPESQAWQQGESDDHRSQAPVVDPEKNATQSVPQPSPEHQRTNPDSPKRGESFSKRDQQAKRTFAILTTDPGDNPWDLESRLLNFKTVMGTKVWDWFLPIRESPCCNHEHPESRYALGPTVDLLKAKVYFKSAADIRVKKGSKRFEIRQLPAVDEPSQLAADGNNQQVVDEANLRVVSEALVNDDNQHDPGGQISLANLNSRGEQIQPA